MYSYHYMVYQNVYIHTYIYWLHITHRLISAAFSPQITVKYVLSSITDITMLLCLLLSWLDELKVCVAMYICTYVCMYVCMYLQLYVRTYVHVHTYIHTYVCVYWGTIVQCMCICYYIIWLLNVASYIATYSMCKYLLADMRNTYL